MKTTLITPTAAGKRLAYPLTLHQPRAGTTELRITFATSSEHFENWLYFLLRDAGAHIETTDPAAVAHALGLASGGSCRVNSSSRAKITRRFGFGFVVAIDATAVSSSVSVRWIECSSSVMGLF